MYRPIMLLFTWACYPDDWLNTAATRKKHPISKNRNNVLQTYILIWNRFLYQPIHNQLCLIYKAELTQTDLTRGRLDPDSIKRWFNETPKTFRGMSLSPIGLIKILTYLIWGFLGAAIFDCIIGSCDFSIGSFKLVWVQPSFPPPLLSFFLSFYRY